MLDYISVLDYVDLIWWLVMFFTHVSRSCGTNVLDLRVYDFGLYVCFGLYGFDMVDCFVLYLYFG